MKEDTHTCVDAGQCGASNYADKRTWTCKACSEITGCTACAYNDNLGGPVCSTCTGSNNLVKTAIDGSTTCVAAAQCATADSSGTHFLSDNNDKCILCGDPNTSGSTNDRGKEGCMTCTKTNGSPPTCSACLSGYTGTSTCTKCADNCATCTSADMSTCNKCLPGYFLKSEGSAKECVLCDNVEKGGIEGCATCTFSTSLTCNSCKANYKASGTESVTCTKVCEDETACGGTAGACDAIVIGASGEMTYYCSQCRQQ
ncbi:Variant-specific surface protein [Giardia duodenalis]|uniref:Variant-specific surface protein n=1 Tax=Giardia intestinalis TaxID=5741 RepID=V6U4P3_GIAIN|nr:Variant-specific surface protein [Giardia intestinalis]